MYMRLLQEKVKPEAVDMLRQFYETRVIPELQKMPGCMFAGLIQGRLHPETGFSITLWRTKEDAEAYEKSGISQNFLKEAGPYLSESSEWKVRLSEDLELTYGPVPEEPVIKSYPVKAQKSVKSPVQAGITQMHTRIVSIKVQEEKIEEFNDIYGGKKGSGENPPLDFLYYHETHVVLQGGKIQEVFFEVKIDFFGTAVLDTSQGVFQAVGEI